MSNKSSVANPIGVCELSQLHIYHSVFNTSMFQTMMSKTMRAHLHMFCPRISFVHSSLLVIFEPKWLRFCMVSLLPTTDKSKRSKLVSEYIISYFPNLLVSL